MLGDYTSFSESDNNYNYLASELFGYNYEYYGLYVRCQSNLRFKDLTPSLGYFYPQNGPGLVDALGNLGFNLSNKQYEFDDVTATTGSWNVSVTLKDDDGYYVYVEYGNVKSEKPFNYIVFASPKWSSMAPSTLEACYLDDEKMEVDKKITLSNVDKEVIVSDQWITGVF